MAEKRITPRGEMPELRPATTLDAATIRNAFVFDDRNAQRQIKEYGRLRAKIFNELIVHVAAES
jgi:hypothetical protein